MSRRRWLTTAAAVVLIAAGWIGRMKMNTTQAVQSIPPPPHPGAKPNRLIHEHSPYLLQHAYNPVDWYPWGDEAFARAKKEDKPVFLSVGYAACHWCHVMEAESFSNPEIAALMNENFVCIKVDREERPDIDDIYMTAVQLMTGSGGWPMSVFLTPEGKPFYGGTYFPPEDRFGRPGFPTVLQKIADIWRDQRDVVTEQTTRMVEVLNQISAAPAGGQQIRVELIDQAAQELLGAFDSVNGGFGGAPKFPNAMGLRLLLRSWKRSGDAKALDAVTLSLRKMAAGGMYDQLGGGFHRYSVDAHWLVPHFEKMLYDQALLVDAYLDAYQATGEPLFAQVVSQTVQAVHRDMTDKQGGFYSSLDADSEHEEGKFYVWTPAETKQLLGDDAELFNAYYGVTETGNFEHGASILHVRRPLNEVAQELGLSGSQARTSLERARKKLLAVRQARVWPAIDDKILAAWNGLMIGAAARAGAVLEEPRFVQWAAAAAEFVWREMRPRAALVRSYRGGPGAVTAFADDYAAMSRACVDLYESSFDAKWLERGRWFADELWRRFWKQETNALAYTQSSELIVPVSKRSDGAVPSAVSLGADALLRLGALLGETPWRERAEALMESAIDSRGSLGHSYPQLLQAVDFYLSPVKEIAIVGPPAAEDTRALLRSVHARFLPHKVIALKSPDANAELDREIPLLTAKRMQHGKPTAYVCRNFACQLPVTTVAALEKQLAD